MDVNVLDNLHYVRKVCAVNKNFGDSYILLYSVFGGGIGTFFYLNDPIKGFCIFAWGILILYIILIIAFSYNESLKKNCLLLINE